MARLLQSSLRAGGARVLVVLSGLAWLAAAAPAERTLSADAYYDRLHGLWFGQLIGNHTGRSFEGEYCTREPALDDAFAWVIKTSHEDSWTGDDDTSFEYLYLYGLEDFGLEPTPAEIESLWDAHVPLTDIYIANRQAKYLMQHGFDVPDTGAWRFNMHAYAIDAQITTESLGALSPGMRQWAVDAARRFGSVTNDGAALHAAECYAAMFAVAAFESDMQTIVALGQAAIPQSSRSWQVVQDVRDWYAADLADGSADWRATRRLLYDYYCGAYDHNRYRYWIESAVNLANTTLALLYGDGDFETTVRIAVLAGFDADCNAATAGGLVGLLRGYDALPVELTGEATDDYQPLSRPGLPEYDTITGIAARYQAITELVILASGGSVDGGVYTVSDEDPVTPDAEQPDPPGPTGLVGAVLAAGGSVSTAASVERHDLLDDCRNLDAIIDGITDVSYNGHRPYDTYDGANPQPPGGDFYQVSFSVPVRFDALTFYEGDLHWSGINDDPRTHPPRGGYFEDLCVQVHWAGEWTAAANLALSEPLDPYTFYQVIELTFDSLPGDAVRLCGNAGGTCEFTTIVELAVTGSRIGDVDGDGAVGFLDAAVFLANMAGPDMTPTPEPPVTWEACSANFDVENDGDLDLRDFALLGVAFGD